MSEVQARLGARLRELRRARRLTQESLAERAGLSYKFIGEIERGRANPTVATIEALCAALSIDLVDLFGPGTVRPQDARYDLTPSEVRQVRESLETVGDLLSRLETAYPPVRRRGASRRRKAGG